MKKYWFLINYSCQGAESGGEHLVKSTDAERAWMKFKNDWQEKYAEDNLTYINPNEIESYSVSKICEGSDIIF